MPPLITPVGPPPTSSTSQGPEFITRANFADKVLRATGPVAVEFMSFACGHCRRADPMVNDVAAALAGRVTVYKVNVMAERALSADQGIVATPTLVMFRGGQEVGRANPDITAAAIRAAILAPF